MAPLCFHQLRSVCLHEVCMQQRSAIVGTGEGKTRSFDPTKAERERNKETTSYISNKLLLAF